GNVQRGVDLVPAGGTVSVEGTVHGDFTVGAKLLTIAFATGETISQQVDTLDVTRRSLLVSVLYGPSSSQSIKFATTKNPGEVQVKVNNLPSGTFLPTGRLIAQGGYGDDDIQVDAGITLSAWLFGGEGNDRLKGGSGDDVLFGGNGDDT